MGVLQFSAIFKFTAGGLGNVNGIPDAKSNGIRGNVAVGMSCYVESVLGSVVS